MRRLALSVTAVLAACMSPIEAESLRYDEDEEPTPDMRILAIPDGVAQAQEEPGVAPEEVEPSAEEPTGVAPRYHLDGDGTVDDCISVGAEGFPAIDRTNRLVAVSQEQWLQLTPLPGSTTLRIISLDGHGVADEMTSIVPEGADTMEENACRSLRRQVKSAIKAANADLEARGFRSMEALAVQYDDAEVPADALLETPARERPLQVIVRHGEAIARIPGVKVYERHAIDRGLGDWLYAVHGDRSTGTVVLTFANCMGDSCTCDPLFTAEVVQWSAQTFAALDAHPCADPDSEDGRCHGTDYGF